MCPQYTPFSGAINTPCVLARHLSFDFPPTRHPGLAYRAQRSPVDCSLTAALVGWDRVRQ